MRIPRRISLLTVLAATLPLAVHAQANTAASKRVVYYYQTQYSNGTYVSLAPLYASANLNASGNPYTTDVLVGAFHLGAQSDGTQIHLNDDPPSSSMFTQMFQETATLQSKGVNVSLFLGGAGDGSFENLVSNWSTYYPVLKQTLETYNFNGIDLDVEDGTETTAEIETLINQLRSDFGSSFVITLAPVATDLTEGSGLSNINYKQLYADEGSNINWFNVQFYSGFGSLASTTDYQDCINNGFPANVVVAGMLSNSAEGSGYVDISTVQNTVSSLVSSYSNFGGVDAFEYFNAEPGGTANPAEWGTDFAQTMGAN